MTALYTIENHADGLAINDGSDGDRIGKVFTTSRITAASDSHAIVEECREWFAGEVESVEHDGETIHVTCTIPAQIGL